MKNIDTINLPDYLLNRKVKIHDTDYDRRRRFSKKQVELIRGLYCKGISISDIAALLETSYGTIQYHIRDDKDKKEYNKKRNDYARYWKEPKSYKSDLANYKRMLLIENKELVVK